MILFFFFRRENLHVNEKDVPVPCADKTEVLTFSNTLNHWMNAVRKNATVEIEDTMHTETEM